MSMICQYSNHCLSNIWAVLLLQAGRRYLIKAETRVKSQVTSFQLRDAQNDIGRHPACSFFGFMLIVTQSSYSRPFPNLRRAVALTRQQFGCSCSGVTLRDPCYWDMALSVLLEYGLIRATEIWPYPYYWDMALSVLLGYGVTSLAEQLPTFRIMVIHFSLRGKMFPMSGHLYRQTRVHCVASQRRKPPIQWHGIVTQ